MEILIIGGGVIGLSIARELKKRGAGRVRVLEKGRIGREASWAAAGILASQVEADEDGEFFRLCYESNTIYKQFAEELLDETGIDIELDHRGIIYAGFDATDEEELEQRFRWQSAAGLHVERLDRRQLRTLEPNVSDRAESGLLFPDDGQVENRKLVEALAASCISLGVKIEESVEVKRINAKAGRVDNVETNSGSRRAANVVIASGAWSTQIDLDGLALPVVVKPIRGQIICYQPTEVSFQHVVYSRRGYLVPRADGRLLAGATVEDVGFDAATTDSALRHLKEIAVEIAPELRQSNATDQWAGLRPFADGGLPFIGAVDSVDGLFAAIGHFRNGILLAPITARIIADRVLGLHAISHSMDR